jgi:hypothetical protein
MVRLGLDYPVQVRIDKYPCKFLGKTYKMTSVCMYYREFELLTWSPIGHDFTSDEWQATSDIEIRFVQLSLPNKCVRNLVANAKTPTTTIINNKTSVNNAHGCAKKNPPIHLITYIRTIHNLLLDCSPPELPESPPLSSPHPRSRPD